MHLAVGWVHRVLIVGSNGAGGGDLIVGAGRMLLVVGPTRVRAGLRGRGGVLRLGSVRQKRRGRVAARRGANEGVERAGEEHETENNEKHR